MANRVLPFELAKQAVDAVNAAILGGFAFLNVPKIGPQRSIQILNVGSAMPHGYYPSYNPSEQGAYTYGVVEATVQAGRIVQHHFIPMLELERRYA